MEQNPCGKAVEARDLKVNASAYKTWKRVLILSLVLNILGLTGGGFYLYKTRGVLIDWYNRRIKGVEATEVRDMRYHGQRLHAFELLNSNANEKRAVIFIGDSLTDTFEWGEYFTALEDVVVLNRGICGDRIEDLINRLDATFPKNCDVEKVFIMVGISDMSKVDTFSSENFLEKYYMFFEKLMGFLPPHRICVQSILPVRERKISNMEIGKINRELSRYAQSKGLCYINLHDELADSTGQLDIRYSLDGVHLTARGYKVWLENIRPYIFD